MPCFLRVTSTRRHCFTMLEMLVTLSIILIVSGVMGVNIINARKQQTFQAGVAQVTNKLRMAQDFMLMLKSDIKVKLKKAPGQDKGIICEIEIDRVLPPALHKLVHHRSHIAGVEAAMFIDDQEGKHIDNIELLFISGGSKMSRGILHLYATNTIKPGSKQCQITLPGYPKTIQNASTDGGKLSDKGMYNDVDEPLYPTEAMEIWATNKKDNQKDNNAQQGTNQKTTRTAP